MIATKNSSNESATTFGQFLYDYRYGKLHRTVFLKIGYRASIKILDKSLLKKSNLSISDFLNQNCVFDTFLLICGLKIGQILF